MRAVEGRNKPDCHLLPSAESIAGNMNSIDVCAFTIQFISIDEF